METLFKIYKKKIEEPIVKERKDKHLGVFLSFSFDVGDSRMKENGYADDCEKIATDISDYSGQESPSVILEHQIPQPVIGAVLLFPTGKVYCSSRSGLKIGDHAEYTVITEAKAKGEDLSHSVLFTSLEPCTKYSRHDWTESCSELVINSRIPEVYFGCLDANPSITGIGLKAMMEQGVIVHSFIPEQARISRDKNKEFFNSFETAIDWKIMRDSIFAIKPLVDEVAVSTYLFPEQEGMQTITQDDWFAFFEEMILRHAIVKGNVLKYDSTPEFALAFYKRPQLVVHGFDVSIYDNTKPIIGKGPKRQSSKVKDFAPTCLLRMLSQRKGFNGDSSNVYGAMQNILSTFKDNDLFSMFGETVFPKFVGWRELIVNAFVHADYSQNVGIVIKIANDSLTIINPITDLSIIELLNKGTMLSYPTNPMLMDFLNHAKLVEKEGQGTSDLVEDGLVGTEGKIYKEYANGSKKLIQTKITISPEYKQF